MPSHYVASMSGPAEGVSMADEAEVRRRIWATLRNLRTDVSGPIADGVVLWGEASSTDETLGLDSIDIMELIFSIEDEFEIELPLDNPLFYAPKMTLSQLADIFMSAAQ